MQRIVQIVLDQALPIAAALSLAMLAIGFIVQMIASQFQPVNPAGLCHGFRRRILAMELAATPFEVSRILGSHNRRNRDVMRQAQWVDYVFIAAYWLLFLDLAGVLARRKFPYAFWAGGAAALCATLAAYCDGRENWRVLQTIRLPLDASAKQCILDCRAAALVKWMSIFLAIAILSILFLKWPEGPHADGYQWLGRALLATGLIGMAAIPSGPPAEGAAMTRWGRFAAAMEARVPYGRRVEFATGLMSICLVALTLVLVYLAAFALHIAGM